MKMTLDLNSETLILPFKWTSAFHVMLDIHPVEFHIQYTEQVGPNSWETSFVVYNPTPIEEKTFMYSRTVGDHDVNEGHFMVLDWNQMIPKNYTESIRYIDDKPADSSYSYKVQLRSVDRDIFLHHFKGDMESVEELFDQPYGVIGPNGFVCVSN